MFVSGYAIAVGIGVLVIGQFVRIILHPPEWLNRVARQKGQENPPKTTVSGHKPAPPEGASTTNSRLYRIQELQRVIACLKANAPILVVGKEGSGKTKLATAVADQLDIEGFTVACIEPPATPKYLLTEIAEQLGLETRNLEGRVISLDNLKTAIAYYFQENTAFLVIDDAHKCDARFRDWLKLLKRQGVPMLLLATDPPCSDVFINLPRIELKRLPDYAIREIMEQAALEKGLNLTPSDLARLQERAGGNPMLAERTIEEEYLGVDAEAGDHGQYVDGMPLILVIGVGFVILRFIGLGTNNHGLYVFGGMMGGFFFGISRLFYSLPKEARRISS